jgi:hypothetical protein
MVAEIRYSARSFARTPGLTIALLTTIALGIGSNAAVFAFIRGLVTSAERPLSVTDRAVTIFGRDSSHGYMPVTFDQYARVTAGTAAFDLVGVAREADAEVTIDGTLLYLPVARTTPELATLLQLSPDGGAIVSDRLWRSQFDGDADLTSRQVIVDDVEIDVGSVAPAWLDGLFAGRLVDIWLPLDAASLDEAQRRSRTFWVLARLRGGVSIERAEASIAAADPDGALAVLPYTGVGPDAAAGVSQLSRLLPGAAGLVFLIACANVMAFLLSRAAARSQETSLRVALGANRRQLIASLLADGMLIAFAGAAGGALLAFWTAGVIPAMFLRRPDSRRLRDVRRHRHRLQPGAADGPAARSARRRAPARERRTVWRRATSAARAGDRADDVQLHPHRLDRRSVRRAADGVADGNGAAPRRSRPGQARMEGRGCDGPRLLPTVRARGASRRRRVCGRLGRIAAGQPAALDVVLG